MNTSNTSAPWVPYKIPPTPSTDVGQKYFLAAAAGAVSNKNPSQFLEWREIGFPKGSTKGDLLYWDPAANSGGNDGGGGAWAILAAPSDNGSILYWNNNNWNFLVPPSSSGLKVLTATGGNLAWTETEDCD